MTKTKPIIQLLFSFLLSIASIVVFGQTPTDSLPGDPGGIYAYTIQNLSFGAFARANNGGSVNISTSGTRIVTGDIIPLNLGFQYYNAIFDVESPPGNIISLLNGPPVTLFGSYGGTMTLVIGASDPNSPFVNNNAPPNRKQINVGGILTVGNLSTTPPGSYSGVFYITFNQE